jgi:hypothetical protein
LCPDSFVSEDCEQIAAPPDIGFVASASTVYRTLPLPGGEKVIFPAEKLPTFGLLAGTISMYWAQNAPIGLPVAGQAVADWTATFEVEPCRSGIVTGRVAPLEGETDCSALVLTSIFAPMVPFSAVTIPWIVAGPFGVPISAKRGRVPTLVPPGTLTTTVAL